MSRWASHVGRCAAVLAIGIVGLCALVPRGVCLAALVSEADCCRAAGPVPEKACCRLHACDSRNDRPGKVRSDAGEETDALPADAAAPDEAPPDESAPSEPPPAGGSACPVHETDELPTPLRPLPDPGLLTVVGILPPVMVTGAGEISRGLAQADCARAAPPPRLLNCILRI